MKQISNLVINRWPQCWRKKVCTVDFKWPDEDTWRPNIQQIYWIQEIWIKNIICHILNKSINNSEFTLT